MFGVEILGLTHSVCWNFRSNVSASIFSVLASCLKMASQVIRHSIELHNPDDFDLNLVMVLMCLFIQS